MKCKICDVNEYKYKCPECHIHYCSLTCWKDHKTKCVPIEKESTKNAANNDSMKKYEFPTEDTVPTDKLKLLDSDEKLHYLLKNPQLRDILKAVDESSNPEAILQKAMVDPIFVEFADQCIKLIEPDI